MERFEPNLERITRDIMKLAEFTSPDEPGHTRTAFSDEDRRAREHLSQLMEREASLTVRVDAVGNLIGRREGKKQKPSILIGSHADTVRGGGRFDGVAGVIAGIEVIRRLEEKKKATIHPLEVVIFLAEEPTPLGISTVGSRGMVGKLPEDVLGSLRDHDGRALGMMIREMGGDPERIFEAKRSRDDVLAYLELHIEQGPHLFSRSIPIGVVTGIAGICRGQIEVRGRNDHAGTTPMEVRKDALAAASEVILAVEDICQGLDGVVGTVGKVEVFPNSLNVVPGAVRMGMEHRSLSVDRIDHATSLFRTAFDEIGEKRGLGIDFQPDIVSRPVFFDSKMVDRICRACQRLDIPYEEMPSGAGHDAQHMAEITSAGMIFIPSKDGRSHCPEEWSEFEDVCLGTEVLACTVAAIDEEERP